MNYLVDLNLKSAFNVAQLVVNKMLKNKQIKFFKISSELGAGTRGASKSFDGINKAAKNKGSSIFKNFKVMSIKDENESLFKNINFPNAKRIK